MTTGRINQVTRQQVRGTRGRVARTDRPRTTETRLSEKLSQLAVLGLPDNQQTSTVRTQADSGQENQAHGQQRPHWHERVGGTDLTLGSTVKCQVTVHAEAAPNAKCSNTRPRIKLQITHQLPSRLTQII